MHSWRESASSSIIPASSRTLLYVQCPSHTNNIDKSHTQTTRRARFARQLCSLSLSSSYHSEHENEVRELQQQKTELELQFPTLCVPDPDLAGDSIPILSLTVCVVYLTLTLPVTLYPYCHLLYVLCT
jgi:hypothetical protein